MIDLDRALTSQKLRARLILQVHDELVLDVPKDEQSVVEKILAETMEGAMKLSVPLRVNVSSGATWADL